MNMFDEALAVKRMLGVKDMTQKKLAALLGVSQPYIANKLRLLLFSDTVRDLITKYNLSERHARTVLRLPDEKLQIEAIEKIHIGKMNVARTEIAVDCMLNDKRCGIDGENTAERICSFERALSSSLSLLREFGIRTFSTTEVVGDRIYISISIN